MKQIFYILILLGLLSEWSFAQTAFPFTFDRPLIINSEKGLPSDQVNTVVKDRTGFIWVGTEEGLARFDGLRLDIFQHQRNDTTTIPNNWIECLVVDHTNRLWVGTNRGLCYYRPEDRTFGTIPASLDSSLAYERILNVHEDHSRVLWVGTPSRLVRLDLENQNKQEFTFSVEPQDSTFDVARINGVLTIASDADQEVLWLGTLSGLIKFNKTDHSYKWYPNKQKNSNDQYLGNSIRQLDQLPNGKLLIGTWNGAFLFDPYQQTFQRIIDPKAALPDLFKSKVVSFLTMPEHDLVGITYSSGFCWYNLASNRIEATYSNNAISGQIHTAHFIDDQARVWGLSSWGLYQYNPLVNRIKQHKFPFQNKLYPIIPRRVISATTTGTYYLAAISFSGIISWQPKTDRWAVLPAPVGENWSSGVQDLLRLENGRVIILAHHQLFELLEDQQTIVPLFSNLDFGTPAFRRMIEGAPNELWIGSRRGGLYRLNLTNGDLKIYKTELDKIPGDTRHRWIETLYKDSRGQIWIRTSFEYSVYVPERDTFIHWDSYGLAPDEQFPVITDFQEDKFGNMWLAGEQFGLGRASINAVEKGVMEVINSDDGLPPYNVGGLGMDEKGYLWMEHEKGITRYHPGTGKIRYFSTGYGIPQTINEFITPIEGNKLAVGISGGIAVFNPKDLTANEELPIPYLTSFKVFDRELQHMNSRETPEEIRLSYRQNFFSFEFSALAFNLPEQVRFRYRLSGFDQQWNESGNRRYAAYTNIPGGDYVFQLEATNNEGNWNHEALEVPMHITTPWWKSLWFWFPSGSFAAMAMVFAVRWRIRQVREQEKIKSEFDKKLVATELHALRAQMNPHFIFNCLNSIDYYIIKNETEKASDYLNRFSRLIRLILQNSRAEYVNLKDELEALKLYMEMESLRFDDRFEYVVRIGSGLQLDNLEIPPLLLQPYVENAIWHGLAKKSNGKNRLDLTITRRDNLLYCRIEDNGIGREAARRMKSASTGKHRSMGMYLTRDRLHRINRMHNSKADVEITDLKDEQGTALGTRVDIIVPIR
ncbi:ligand-binding sensor domain-containing protein [Flavilitoribacter nigricans]|uniref:Histidine kinase n=1 Tax=Flavilitoribacter nigricans (strain ATCC 23147 / DSM 23189 / NBRC 102662 / NCIMB 1420 / SS-2) TaxID=1122177 RepID=A0A2D0N3H0_FLAN2|nr:sensor histidine kinase [Flavilitoribacter nigricans]PHN02926.1 hypothetical protein CRP01_29410 [Flavilitoribacter nigricans DSM 23189 = NBRC 102662]